MNGDLFFDGNRYISSSRASKITGYDQDYIGELCRDGKLECRKVSRSWYVGFDSILKHKNLKLNGTRLKVSKKEILPIFFEVPKEVENIESPPSVEVRPSDPVTKILPQASYPDFDAVDRDAHLIALTRILTPVSTPAVALERAQRRVVPRPVFARDQGFGGKKKQKLAVPFKIALTATALFVMIIGFRFGLSSDRNSNMMYGAAWKSVASGAELGAASFLSEARDVLSGTSIAFYHMVRDLLFGEKETILVITDENSSSVDNPIALPSANSQPDRGMVVVPASEGMDDDKTIETIKQSFSDEVLILESNEDTGVITPVFKDSKGDEYLYVLVPIDS